MYDERFKRFVPLVGEESFAAINHCKVAVFGIGGVGSYAAEALGRSGVGQMTLIDYDTIALHNINRQIHALNSTVGQKKVEVMSQRLKEINPALQVETICAKVTRENLDDILSQKPDYILDAVDDVEAKIALIIYALQENIPIIAAMGTGNKLRPEKLKIEDISRTSVCPLCRRVRRRLREEGIFKGVPVVYSEEIPITTGIQEGTGQVPASSCLVPPAAGLLMAAWVIRSVSGL